MSRQDRRFLLVKKVVLGTITAFESRDIRDEVNRLMDEPLNTREIGHILTSLRDDNTVELTPLTCNVRSKGKKILRYKLRVNTTNMNIAYALNNLYAPGRKRELTALPLK